jgi:cytochrome c5
MLKKTLFPMMLVALLAACGGKQEAAPAAAPAQAAPTQAVAAAAPAPAENAQGEKVFKGTCALCHQTGAGGAPVVANKGDWAPRIAQGKETLYTHAISGYTGQKGAMPPKGANASLADADVKAAVDYMVGKSM